MKIFNIIDSVYTNTSCRIKFSNGLSHYFSCERGVEQGDVLSPLLFNYFINDIIKSLNQENTDPISIADSKINILLYADDIVFFALK